MKCSKKVKFIIVMVALLLIAVLIINYSSYISAKRKSEISSEKYTKICNEFLINESTADFEYIYSQGSDRYGVRISLNQSSSEQIENVLVYEFDSEKLRSYIKNSTYYEYNCSEETIVSAKNLNRILQNENNYCDIYYFEKDNKYYIEIEKSNTDNIEIYNEMY